MNALTWLFLTLFIIAAVGFVSLLWWIGKFFDALIKGFGNR